MYKGGSPSAHQEKVLIVMNNAHARSLRKAIEEYTEKLPDDRRFYEAVIQALAMIHNKPEGWYDGELRMKLPKKIKPLLSHAEVTKVMSEVYSVVPLREEDVTMRQLREERRQQLQRK